MISKSSCEHLDPFMKWTGGKRWLASHISKFLPDGFQGTYIEPFLGGGSVFFYLLPKKAILSDINEELITTYLAVKENYKEVERKLVKHHENHSRDYYYKVRSDSLSSITSRAARMLYLNRTCFNGIYRVNQKGEFNVPIGTRDTVIREDDNWPQWSLVLQKAKILCSDFEPIINRSTKGDFLFVDPPYTVKHNNNGFIKYNENLFQWHDQERLANSLEAARKRGVYILITNANHSSVSDLYGKGFYRQVIERNSSIAASKEKRAKYQELILTSYRLKET